MANCKYILGQRVFNSEIQLDDYLSEMKNLYKQFGDEVFSKSWTPVQQTYRQKLFSQKEQLEKAIKSGRIKLEISDIEDLDLDGIVDSAEGRGVTSIMQELKSLDNKNVFPIFNKDNYWNNIRGELRDGNWNSDKIKDFIPYIFDEKDSEGNYITHPITTEEEFNQIRNRIESMWKQQGLIGTVVHDIFDILYSNYTTENGTNIKNLPKQQFKEEIKKVLSKKPEPNAYRKLLNEFGTDLNKNNSFLESVIDNALKFNEDLKQQFDPKNEGLMVLPEITIKGMATLNNQLFKVIGRMDMVVIKPNGEVHIIDYKCSPKEYRNYNEAKKLTFNYQLAVYRRILQQLGINKDQIHLWVVPIQFTNFNIDKSNNLVTLDGVKLRDGATFEELEVSSPTVNAHKYQIVEDNLNNSFKYEHVEDISDEHILEKTRNWIRKVFPEYSKISEVTDENVLDFCKRKKCVVQDEKTGKWGFRRYKNADLKYVKDTEQEVINAIKQEWENNRQRNLESTKSLKKELKKAQKENLGRGALFNITLYSKDKQSQKTPDWAQQIIQKYANEDWTVEETPEALDSLGIILVRNLTTDRIDVVKLSSTYDLDAEIGFGNNRTTLFGNFVSDHVAKSQPNSLVMQSTRGNVELMETMYALNCMPSIFNNDNAFLGEIQVISHYNEGGGANNKSLLYNFQKLMNYSNKEDSPEVNYFNNKNIKVASFVQLAQDTLTRIINNNQGTRWNKFEEASNNLHKFQGNKEQMLSELIKLKQQIENVPGFEYLARDGVMTSIYDDYNSPEKRLYAEVMLAIGEIGGLTYQQQTKDHANIFEGNSLIKAFLWDGFNGNLTDNPGTLRSETLNQASHLVDVAYQNIRDQLFKYKNNLEKILDEYKQYKGQFASQKELYKNFYNEDITDDLVFKNPFIQNNRLDDMERKVLKAILLDIAHRRNSTIINEDTLKSAIENDPDYLLVPLIKSTSKPVTKSLGDFMSRTRKFLMGFNIKNAKDSLKEKLLDFTSKESTNEPNREETIWEMTNSIDVNPENRKERITLGGGIENFETNLEMLALKHEYAYIQKQEINKILPFMKALSIHLANQGIILNDNFENDLNYIQNFIKAKIQNKKLQDIQSLDNSFVSDLMKGTSILALAFNPKQLYQIIDGLWKDIRLIVQNAHQEGDINISFKNFKDSFFWIIQDVAKFNGELSVGEALNQLYGINDMDINQLPSRYAKDTYGTDRLQKAMFRFASRPDYYNRMTIFGAQMRGDGCFEAHSIVDGHLIYDWTKDKRFDIFAKYKGDISKVPSSEQNKFRQQQALYSAMADEMVKDRTLNPDGTNFVKDMKNPKPLPKAYTVKQSESMKALGDKTYGYYASEKKSLIQSFTIGAIIFQMNTFWSSKKNQYFSGRGYTQEGEFVDYVEENPEDPEHPIEYCQKYNEETGEMDIIRKDIEDTGVPYKVWKGRPQEGIIITLNHMLMNILTGERDYEGIRFWDPYWNDDDPYLRKMYRANLRQLLADLLGMILIGMIISPSLVNAANSYAKEIGSETIGEATMGYLTTLSAGMLQTSTDDFNFTKSVFGRGIQWTPFSLQSGTRFLTNCGNWLFGDQDFYDTLTKQMAFTRNAKPIMNFIKNETLGRDIGDNGKPKD